MCSEIWKKKGQEPVDTGQKTGDLGLNTGQETVTAIQSRGDLGYQLEVK